MEFRDLKKQYRVLQPQLDKAIVDVVASGAYINGTPVKDLEQQLADYVGVKHCKGCANGTDALTLALKAWNVGKGDAVFVPDFTFFASAETVAAEGALPVFVDVDRQTYNMDVDDLEEKIYAVEKEGRYCPKVVVAVDLFGLPADYPRIMALAKQHRLLILEDGAQGFGGAIAENGSDGTARLRRACSFGDISTTSFFPAKPLGCYGDGGAVFTDNDEWASTIDSLCVHGKGSFKYDNVRIGMNSRLDTVQAAVLIVKLKAFKDYELEAVNKAAHQYDELLNDKVATLPFVPDGFTSSWAQYTIQLENRTQRDAVQKALKEKGIPSMVYYPKALHAQTAFQYIGTPYGACPNTDRLCDTVLSLPMHPYMTGEEIESVCCALVGVSTNVASL